MSLSGFPFWVPVSLSGFLKAMIRESWVSEQVRICRDRPKSVGVFAPPMIGIMRVIEFVASSGVDY